MQNNRLHKSFKELIRLIFRMIGIPILATIGKILLLFLFVLAAVLLGHPLTFIMPVEAAMSISTIFVLMFTIFGVNEIVNFYNGYR